MGHLEKYISSIKARGNQKLAQSLQNTAEEIGSKYLKTFSFFSHEIGLLFGNIQSGKTGQMFGILCKAADLGFPAFIILTTDNITLQQQTLERVKHDLDEFCICGENDSKLFMSNNLEKPVIVVLKKNVRILKLWANVFNSTDFMRGNPLFIFDDEADSASLNTMVNKDKQSSINTYLESIIKGSSSSLYLQVTATPQAILLQTLASGWHPYFTHYFHPGDGYLGGDFFFPQTHKPKCITSLKNISNPERAILLRHLVVTAQILSSGGVVSNCIMHPSVRQAAHARLAEKVTHELQWCIAHADDDLLSEIEREYNHLESTNGCKLSFENTYEYIKGMLISDTIKTLIVNATTDVSSSDYATGCNFIIGGNTLGRGITFPRLQTIYYTRTSKQPQADTMWQHSRMFGYDRDPNMMMVYIDDRLYKLFSDINETNNSIVNQITHGLDKIKIIYPIGLNPTRKNVLDNDHLNVLAGGKNYYPFYPDNDSIDDISMLLEPFSNETSSYQVSLRIIRKLLSHIIASSDFNLEAFLSFIDAIISENTIEQGILLVRRNRDVAQGTGALLSPNDWQMGSTFKDKVVLTMYQVTGTKGWGGKALWVPNIKLPHNSIYYDVKESKE